MILSEYTLESLQEAGNVIGGRPFVTMIWAAVLTAAALFLIWKAGLMVWYVRYRPKGKVVYNTAPDIVTPGVTLSPLTSISLTVGTPFARVFSGAGGTAP